MASWVRALALLRGVTIAQNWSAILTSVGKDGFVRTRDLPATDVMVIVMAVFLSLDCHSMDEDYVRSAICVDSRALEWRKDTSKMNAVP